MLYTIGIITNTKSTVTVDPGYQPIPGAACMGFIGGLNCPHYPSHTIHVDATEYVGAETYCDEHIAEGLINLLEPEPDGCDGGCHH